MIDVAPRELPSSITGRREALWRCSMIGVILGGRFAIFAVWCRLDGILHPIPHHPAPHPAPFFIFFFKHLGSRCRKCRMK